MCTAQSRLGLYFGIRLHLVSNLVNCSNPAMHGEAVAAIAEICYPVTVSPWIGYGLGKMSVAGKSFYRGGTPSSFQDLTFIFFQGRGLHSIAWAV